jgi:hypothetical protein
MQKKLIVIKDIFIDYRWMPVFLLFSTFIKCYAQDDNPSKYFDDLPSLSNATLLKGIYDPLQSGYYLAFEHQAIPNMGLEYGFGFVTNNRQITLLDLMDIDYPHSDEKIGKVAWISARLYKYGYAEQMYMGSSLMARKGADYFLPSFQLIQFGFQRPLLDHFAYDLNFQFGFGVLFSISEQGRFLNLRFVDMVPSLQLQAKLAYIL